MPELMDHNVSDLEWAYREALRVIWEHLSNEAEQQARVAEAQSPGWPRHFLRAYGEELGIARGIGKAAELVKVQMHEFDLDALRIKREKWIAGVASMRERLAEVKRQNPGI